MHRLNKKKKNIVKQQNGIPTMLSSQKKKVDKPHPFFFGSPGQGEGYTKTTLKKSGKKRVGVSKKKKSGQKSQPAI